MTPFRGLAETAGEILSPAATDAAVSTTVQAGDLIVDHLVKRFEAGTEPILNGISFRLMRGEAVALIGANGTGKSTLMRCCLGLLPVDSGDVQVLGANIVNLPRRDLRQIRARAGFVFQRHNLVPRLSALSNVVHGAQAWMRGPRAWHQVLAARQVREEAMYCLELVGLAHLARRRVDRLSGGQSQRVAIARALMQRPRIMFADEPVASLDPNAGEEVMDLFVRLIKQEGLTLFFSSHHLEHAVTYGDRVIGLRGGVVALDAPAATLSPEGLRGLYD